MSASTADQITDTRNAARPNSARVTSPRSSGGGSLACDSLAGWPTAANSKVHFVTYQITSTNAVVAGTQLDCSGIVTGNTINSMVVIDGNDEGNSVGDVVEMLPTAAWAQDLADALTHQHDRQGNHLAINNTGGLTTDTATVTGNAVVGGVATFTGIPVLPAGTNMLGYVQQNSNFTTASTTSVQITGMTLTVTVPAGGRSIKITAYMPYVSSSSAPKVAYLQLWDGVVNTGTVLHTTQMATSIVGQGSMMMIVATVTPSAGSKTYNLAAISDGAGGVTTTYGATSSSPMSLLVEAI